MHTFLLWMFWLIPAIVIVVPSLYHILPRWEWYQNKRKEIWAIAEMLFLMLVSDGLTPSITKKFEMIGGILIAVVVILTSLYTDHLGLGYGIVFVVEVACYVCFIRFWYLNTLRDFRLYVATIKALGIDPIEQLN